MNRSISCLASLTLAVSSSMAAAHAQGSVLPFALNQQSDCVGLSLAKLGVATAKSLNVCQIPGDPAGTYYVSMTVTGLAAARGGKGGNDLLTGRYDILTDTFTENLDAAGLNTSGGEFMLGLHANGLFAIIDVSGDDPHFATRPDTKSAFVDQGAVLGIALQNWYDPNLATVDGALYIVCTIGSDIAIMALNPVTRAVGAPKVIARPVNFGDLNSAAPIVDANGEMIGISYHELSGNDNDHYVSFDLDPATPGLLVNDTSDFYSNGSFVGGRYFAAVSQPTYRLTQRDFVWCSGGRAALGATMDIAAYVPPELASTSVSYLMFASSFVSSPLSIPGFSGDFGLGFGAWNILQIGAHATGTGRATLGLAVPNDASLRGLSLPSQSLTIETKSQRLIFGNTCVLGVK